MIAVDSSILIEILSDAAEADAADAAEAALRDCLARGPLAVCEVVVAEVCSSLKDGDRALDVLEDMGIHFIETGSAAAIRAGEMQRRYRSRGGKRQRTIPDFIVGAHALLQCKGLVTRDEGFFRDYFKGLKLIVPQSP